MAVDTTSMFAQVIQDHLELKRRNAALEHEMPLERYLTDDPFENHPLFKTEEQARLEDTMGGVTGIEAETTSLDWPTTDDTFMNYEGCLSVPNLRGEVPRFAGVRVKALDRTGNPLDFEVKGLTAGTFQHELDHLDGKLFVDRVTDTRTLATWADFERYHLKGFAERARALVAKYGS